MTRLTLLLLLLIPTVLAAQTDRQSISFTSQGMTVLVTSALWECRDTVELVSSGYEPGVFQATTGTTGAWTTTGGSLGTETLQARTYCRPFVERVVLVPAADGSMTFRAETVRLWLGPPVLTTDR